MIRLTANGEQRQRGEVAIEEGPFFRQQDVTAEGDEDLDVADI